jgi:beta-glucanase (GH16 family)
MLTSNLKLAGVLAAALTVTTSLPHPKPKPVAKAPRVIFFDDFNGKTLDRTKWNVRLTHNVVNNEQQAYVDSAATIYIAHGAEAAGAKNGVLVIKPVFSEGFVTPEGKKFDFLSGRLDTRAKVEFTYGTASARMKLPAGAGSWPAFWALGNGKWPDCGEIDVMENIGDPTWVSAALHGPGYFGNTPIIKKFTLKADKDITQWHVYSVDWDATSLTFKVDGQEYYKVTKPMIEVYGRWAYDNPKYLIVNLALGGAYPAKVNGATSPYNGIPQATVNDIKAGNGKVLVDWVKVTSAD